MARLIVEGEGEQEVPDGENITETAEELGIPIGCSDGICQACRVEVIEGMENLSEKTQQEQDLDLDDNERLACQCSIKSGTVKVRY